MTSRTSRTSTRRQGSKQPDRLVDLPQELKDKICELVVADVGRAIEVNVMEKLLPPACFDSLSHYWEFEADAAGQIRLARERAHTQQLHLWTQSGRGRGRGPGAFVGIGRVYGGGRGRGGAAPQVRPQVVDDPLGGKVYFNIKHLRRTLLTPLR